MSSQQHHLSLIGDPVAVPKAPVSHPSMFRDFQAHVHELWDEVELVHRTITENDEALRMRIDDLTRELQDETYERKDTFDRVRLEFEVFAHRKTERVVQELEEFNKDQTLKDRARDRQLLDVSRDVDQVKLSLCSIGVQWGKVAASLAAASEPTP
eukprot:CAMPEP_0117509020 /NCGR_PEP_ID=MMETSP0784-20121206/27255_1 /TAXON_ID=39447 /ORGANISM="" /LENGTH=154 /DNA_ID=CAMNT_0005304605 /DNA_START=62 /DNA_END=523 /DNA_ORIENTATION=-